MAPVDEYEPVEVKNCLELVRHLDEQEIEMVASALEVLRPEYRFRTWLIWALLPPHRLDVVIDALLEAEQRGLFLTVGAARDLACKLISLRDGVTS
jgi:hypothetical protein